MRSFNIAGTSSFVKGRLEYARNKHSEDQRESFIFSHSNVTLPNSKRRYIFPLQYIYDTSHSAKQLKNISLMQCPNTHLYFRRFSNALILLHKKRNLTLCSPGNAGWHQPPWPERGGASREKGCGFPLH